MKANDFVKEYGIDIARECLEERPKTWEICYLKLSNFEFVKYIPSPLDFIDVDDLKRLVESHELVEKHQGLNGARNVLKLLEESLDIGLYHGIDGVDAITEVPKIKQAIADVESCM